MKLFGMTDVGCVRTSNQDAFAIEHREDYSYILVCDGMGGHRGGDVASQIAVTSMKASFAEHFDACAGPENIREFLRNAIEQANREIFAEALKNFSLKGMGTTIVLALAVADTLFFAHVGDSRAYAWQDGAFCLITKDHSLVQEMMDIGELTADEAAVHPYRHVITRVLGIAPEVNTDIQTVPLSENILALICSDGLNNQVSDETIGEEILRDDLPTLCSRLIDLAKQSGGNDNITVAVMQNGGKNG